jgi:predicted PurR-regulated permease PerM
LTDPVHPSPKAAQTRIEQGIAVIVLIAIVIGCFLVLRPFLSALLWALILCCTTWPAFNHLRRAIGGSATLASLAMTLVIALVLLAPFVIVGLTLAENANQLLEYGKRFVEQGPPEPPAWVAQIPLIGERLQTYWAGFTHDTTALVEELRKYIEPLRNFALAGGGALAEGLLLLTLSIFIAFFLYRDGETLATRLNNAVGRISGERGQHLVGLAGNTMRGVVYGIIGTAIAQGVIAAIGFWIAGVPAPTLLGVATFVLSPVPVGPPLVWIPAAIWLFYHGSTGWAIFLVVWGVVAVSSVDNFIKPLIISRGSNLPFILVLLGVLGGVVAFGFIGVFIGPTLLAIGFALLQDWSAVKATVAAASRPPRG